GLALVARQGRYPLVSHDAACSPACAGRMGPDCEPGSQRTGKLLQQLPIGIRSGFGPAHALISVIRSGPERPWGVLLFIPFIANSEGGRRQEGGVVICTIDI